MYVCMQEFFLVVIYRNLQIAKKYKSACLHTYTQSLLSDEVDKKGGCRINCMRHPLKPVSSLLKG